MTIEQLTSLEERTIALAGIFQNCHQVQQLATTGKIDTYYLDIAVKAILNTSPENTLSIFQGIPGIRDGLNIIQQQLGHSKSPRDTELTRYSISVLFLANKLLKNPDMLKQLSNGIEKAQNQVEHFGDDHTNIYANLGGLYSDTISQLNPRIMVSGEPEILNNPDNANKIRTLLLSSIRSAVLWQQLGGSRWQLLLKRKKIVSIAKELS
ncbi:MAG: high frequency lysogenization protein HflD [gamma proteobacterium symbiont of Bathyaustriella thionipta]|nr:high frequency lysogenization protein HflD [gamma proteobacterium symbiont of Bathyaustriella thionipta]MCU7948877.1 high frequency lysogenization protein HflD [gamma proteobacterium symbiont of Bathyaustriella thionipta]MCU7952379.1 high frequency lysogenization protein HflD [gamma proteobacterium symbiont of Bathyaustriella thionipta]MCU7955334.1 high frequency lysogenization protein HflD [gamma proteobacterium symbiont of Bathyaustriella thionipta]MCU7966118.1 high frequency lysogenizatio